MPTLRSLCACLVSLALLTLTQPSFGQDFPNKPITIIVPFAPGGSVDLVARTVGAKLSTNLNVPVVPENRPGASATIGTGAAVRAEPDGYTLLMGSTTSISIRPQMTPALPYDPMKDLTPVALAAAVPHVLLVGAQVKAKNVAELLTYARSLDRPLTLGDSGVGSPHYLAGDLFARGTGIKLTHVPYKGTSAVVTDLLSGNIDLGSIELSIAAPYMESGGLNAIGLSAVARDERWPNLPTMIEQGVKDYEITSWFGFFAPAKTPAQVIEKLNREFSAVLKDQEVRSKLSGAGLSIIGGSLDAFRAHLGREREKWGHAIALGDGKAE